jgi:hypothetical protein
MARKEKAGILLGACKKRWSRCYPSRKILWVHTRLEAELIASACLSMALEDPEPLIGAVGFSPPPRFCRRSPANSGGKPKSFFEMTCSPGSFGAMESIQVIGTRFSYRKIPMTAIENSSGQEFWYASLFLRSAEAALMILLPRIRSTAINSSGRIPGGPPDGCNAFNIP